MKTRIFSLLLAFGFLGMVCTHAQDMRQGKVRVVGVQGDVSSIDATTGERTSLSNGAVLSAGYTIETQEASSAILIFTNGSTITLRPKSSLSIEEFLEKPYDTTIKPLSQYQEEPSQSNTQLRLNYGDAIGNVKKLDAQSVYEINSDIGTAGIHGTQWRMSVTVNIGGDISGAFTIDTGLGYFISVAGQQLNVGDQVRVNVRIQTDDQGNVTDMQVESVEITPAESSEIQEATTIQETELEQIPDDDGADTAGAPAGEAGDDDAPPPPLPTPTITAPQTTPTAGLTTTVTPGGSGSTGSSTAAQ